MTDLFLYGLPILAVAFGVGCYVGWTERGKWDDHKAAAKLDEGELP